MDSAEMEIDTTENVLNSGDSEACDKIEGEASGFPSFEIKCAETISEDAFEEEKAEAVSTENGLASENDMLFSDYDTDKTVTKDLDGDNEQLEDVQTPKEQEPVNESSDKDSSALESSPVKQETSVKKEDDGDEPNEDPNVDAADSDLEMDPEIAAAMEASLLEAEQMDEQAAGKDDDQDDKEEGKQPFFMFRNETEVDSNGTGVESNDENDIDAGNDDSLAEDVLSSASVGDEELTLEGEAVTGDMEIGEAFSVGNPIDYNPLEDPGDYDPLVEDGCGIAVDEDTNGFLDKVNSGFMTQIHSFPETKGGPGSRGPRGPYKKKNQDDDYDPLAPPTRPTRTKAKGTLSCNICHFPFESIGDLKLHKYTDHENQPKPTYLDLAEVAIGKFHTTKGGVSNLKILKEIQSDPMITDNTHKAKLILARALKFGVSCGRIRPGKPGKQTQRYYWAKKGVRKGIFDKFSRNKKLVEFDEEAVRNPPKMVPKKKPPPIKTPSLPGISITPVKSSHITQPDPKKFGRGKRTPGAISYADDIGAPRERRPDRRPIGKTFGGEITLDSDSDDDIAIVSEKIVAKPKRKVTIVRVPASQLNKGKSPGVSLAARKLPSTLVRVGGSKPGPASSRPQPKTVAVPSSSSSKKPADDDDDEEEDLTCKVCQSSFWFKGQLVEHLKNTHKVEDTDKYFKK